MMRIVITKEMKTDMNIYQEKKRIIDSNSSDDDGIYNDNASNQDISDKEHNKHEDNDYDIN
eukprot:8563110-Ditylum_brightwellii.AAC.1